MVGDKVSHPVRKFIGAIIVLAVVGVWAYKSLNGESVGVVHLSVAMLLALAAGYAVFGRRAVNFASETIENLKDGETDESEGNESE